MTETFSIIKKAAAAAALSAAIAVQAAGISPAPPAPGDNSMEYSDAAVLGVVEGVTEFLPVSSTGHLILANHFLGLDSDSPMFDSDGAAIESRKPGPDGRPAPYTLKEAADAYAIVIQVAAIAAVALLYWRELWSMVLGFLGRSRSGLMLARNLVAAFLPAAVVGFLLHDLIEELLFGVFPVVAALAAGAVAMIFVQRRYEGGFSDSSPALEIHELSVRQSLAVGCLQCVALWPGTSRSMMTIMGAYMVGLKPVQAAKFSFLLGLVTLSAASAYKMLQDGEQMFRAISAGPLATGFAVAFVSAAVSIKWLVGFLNRRGLVPFAWYRLALAAALLAFMFLK